jgi:hypothetical protein
MKLGGFKPPPVEGKGDHAMIKVRKNSALYKRLVQLNNHYGRGDVMGAVIDRHPEENQFGGVVHRRPYGMQSETRRFRLNGPTLHFLGRQSNVDKPIRL